MRAWKKWNREAWRDFSRRNRKSGRRQGIRPVWRNTDGVGTVEVILILVVLIALVIIFKDQITGMISGIFGNINSSINSLY